MKRMIQIISIIFVILFINGCKIDSEQKNYSADSYCIYRNVYTSCLRKTGMSEEKMESLCSHVGKCNKSEEVISQEEAALCLETIFPRELIIINDNFGREFVQQMNQDMFYYKQSEISNFVAIADNGTIYRWECVS